MKGNKLVIGVVVEQMLSIQVTAINEDPTRELPTAISQLRLNGDKDNGFVSLLLLLLLFTDPNL